MNEFCQCERDGFCERYRRDMAGRLRAICRGEAAGVDAAMSAKYREMWLAQRGQVATVAPVGQCPFLGAEVRDELGHAKLRDCPGCRGRVQLRQFYCTHPAREPEGVTLQDCGTCVWRPKPRAGNFERALILKNSLSPGDVLVMTAAVYSLHRQHPGRFLTAVETTADALFEGNPDIVSKERAYEEGGQLLEMHYPAVHQSNQRGIHMMAGYCEWLEDRLGVKVPLLTNRPMLYVRYREKTWINQVAETGDEQPFWLLNAGVKQDYQAKQYPHYQKVVDLLQGRVRFVQIGERHHLHRPLTGVAHGFLGKTDCRQLVRLVYNCQGVVSGVSFPMHLAAALQKPAVILAGGREPRAWNTYPKQVLFSTVGQYDCCREEACWRSRVRKMGDNSEQDNSLCTLPAETDPPAGRCMAEIEPERVAEEIWKFSGGTT